MAQSSPEVPGKLEVIAFRATPKGSLHSFQFYASALATHAQPFRAALTDWEEREMYSGNQLGGTAPPASVWTEIASLTQTQEDKHDNTVNLTENIYRLNTNQLANQYFMFILRSQEAPNFESRACSFLRNCGWYADNREIFMQGGTCWLSQPCELELYQYGPTGTITSSSAGFTVGGGLSGVSPGGSASYHQSWSQPSVTTTDKSNYSDNLAEWHESFTGQNSVNSNKPPSTSTGSFYSMQAAIFQLPTPTNTYFDSFYCPGDVNTNLSADLGSVDTTWVFFDADSNSSTLESDTVEAGFCPEVSDPFLAVSTPSIRIASGSANARSLTITAFIFTSTLGVNWDITNIPSWLDVSQISGSDTTTVNLTVEPDTPVGTVGTLNIDTDPPYGSPAVATGPLTVNIAVVAAFSGVLVAGGTPTQSPTFPKQKAEVYDPTTQAFEPTSGNMVTPRYGQTETSLPGKILIAGGNDGSGYTATAALYDVNLGTFSATGSMSVPRVGATATLLPGGLVLIAGGTNENGPTASADLYDVSTGTFTPTGDMIAARVGATATLLDTGQVLIAGGTGAVGKALASAEVYSPTSGSFTAVGNMTVARTNAAAALLPNGEVLIAGGGNQSAYALASAEVFNPSTGLFTPTGSMTTSRVFETATALGPCTVCAKNYAVLVTGGDDTGYGVLASAELYDPDSGTFTATLAPMSVERSLQTATLMTSGPEGGDVLIVGGWDTGGDATPSVELFDPKTGYFTEVGDLATPLAEQSAGELQ